ncbi:hypothetical protein CR513_31922, partial [Mucuna pruriens]
NKKDIYNGVNYKGIKLMSYTIKLWENVIRHRLREKLELKIFNLIFYVKKDLSKDIEAKQETYLRFILAWKKIIRSKYQEKHCRKL